MSPPPDGVNTQSRWPCRNGLPHLQSLCRHMVSLGNNELISVSGQSHKVWSHVWINFIYILSRSYTHKDYDITKPCCFQCGHLFLYYIDGLMRERCNSSALAMELHLSCTNPSIWRFFWELVFNTLGLLSTLKPDTGNISKYIWLSEKNDSLKSLII